MHAEFSYAFFEGSFTVHAHHCTVRSRNLWNQVQEKKVALFVNRPMALQCTTFKSRDKNSMHIMERLVAPATEQKFHFFPSTLLNKTDVLIMKITINCKEWPLKMRVRRFGLRYILDKQYWLNISPVISKSVRRELTFLCQVWTVLVPLAWVMLFWYIL